MHSLGRVLSPCFWLGLVWLGGFGPGEATLGASSTPQDATSPPATVDGPAQQSPPTAQRGLAVQYPGDRDRWICMEVRVKLNTPAEADGEQTVWQDGIQIGHFTGIRWRSSPRLKASVFWLMNYVTERAFAHTEQHAAKNGLEASTRSHTVWFDQVVVATAYVGPLQKTPGAGEDED